MASTFHDEDLLEEFNGVPEFLHATKEAVRWLCKALIRVRLKRCGREELAWLFGLPEEALCEALPSSAEEGLFGECLLDISFLPRGSGCMISGCKSAAHLNGRKCTLCKDLRDGALHALVIVEGGTGEQPGTEELDKTILIARKNLELASSPHCHGEDGFPSLSILKEPVEEESDALKPPSEVLGAAWHEPALLPEHLRGGDGLVWLAGVVNRLMDSKGCGCEEIIYLLDLSADGTLRCLGKAVVPASITANHDDSLLEALGFVPSGSSCTVEGCNSYAHLNGRNVQLSQPCPDGQPYAKIDLGEEGELQMHRKNLRLKRQEAATEGPAAATKPEGGTGQSPLTLPQESVKPPSRDTSGMMSKDSVAAAPKQETSSFLAWLLGGVEAPALWCGGGQQAAHRFPSRGCPTLCRRGVTSKDPQVVKEDVTYYPVQCEEGGAADGMHPSFGPDPAALGSPASRKQTAASPATGSKETGLADATRSGNMSGTSAQAAGAPAHSIADKLQKVVQLRAKGQLTDPEFRMAKEQFLNVGSQDIVEELHKLAELQREGWLTEEEFGCAKAKLLPVSSR